jgi:6-phosphogluconolactonase (cycloisomerase 2 family)
VTVVNPAPGGGTSNSVSLNIGNPNPIPTITSITPSTGFVGESPFTLMVTGTNFLPTSLITFGPNARTTTFISSTQLSAVIDANSLASAGTVEVYVSNPAPGGGVSNFVNFNIATSNPVPSISSITPASAATAGAAFTLTAYGSNFLSTSTLNFGGTPEPTTIISTSELTASIPASAIATTGTASVTVTSPGPGGGPSNALNFTVSPGGGMHPAPVIGTLTPTVVSAGGPGFTLTIDDFTSSYVNGSVVRWNGADRPTTFAAANEITAQIPASDYSAPGTASVTVFNPAPGGGLSGASLLTIVAGGLGPVSVAILPDPSHKFGEFVYVANQKSDNISIYEADATTGLLKFSGTIGTDHVPSSVTVDPSGKFLYAANSSSGTISMYTIDGPSGLLTSIGKVTAGSTPSFVIVHPSGKFAYAANFNSNNISMYTVDPTTGHLASIGVVSTATGPRSIAIDPSGNYAYAAEYLGGVGAYTVDLATGVLSPVIPTSAGAYPSTVTVSPSGMFTYVASSGDCDFVSGSVSQYSINPAFNGELSFSGMINTGFCSIGIAVDPTGKFAYVTNSGDNNISMYKIDSSTGLLLSIGLVAAGTSPWSIAVDPSGKFVYVSNFQSNDVSIYSIDPATGSLTLIGTISS